MSLSFSTPIKALTSIGLSVGDIAVLAGAGRAVGTWLKARYIDQSLLDFVDVEDIIPRTGLVDTAALDKRWAKRMVLFVDGQLLPVGESEAKEVLKKVKLDRFTWIMTLITSSLLVSTSQTCLEQVILNILVERCKESEGYEYLARDFKRNIEAWTSIARTRAIARAAEERWKGLELQLAHLPGLIPDSDHRDISRFLLWLIGAGDGGKHSNIFRTASSDTASCAAVLQHIGFDSIRVCTPDDEVEDGLLNVVFDTTRLANEPASALPKRRGMRVNLNNMEETMSLWPGSAARNNQRRDIFLSAAGSTRKTSITIGQWLIADLRNGSRHNLQPLMIFAYEQTGRLQQYVYQFAHMFLLAPDQATLDAFQRLTASWNQTEVQTGEELRSLISSTNEKQLKIAPAHLSDIQTFLLGYYYGLLRPILDISQMDVGEAFGSWTWDDWKLFKILKGIGPAELGILVLVNKDGRLHSSPPRIESAGQSDTRTDSSQNRIRCLERYFVLKLVAYLFGGAELSQVLAVERGCCGVKGKLTVVDAALLGNADRWSQVCKFALLDVDDTVFPSDLAGMIRCGGQNVDMSKLMYAPTSDRLPLDRITLAKGTKDFTSLVEPKWGEDMNACMLTYRRQGRLVHSIDPELIFHAVLGTSKVSPETYCGSEAVRFVTEGLSIDGMTILDEKDEDQCTIDGTAPSSHDYSVNDDKWKAVSQLSLEQFDGTQVPMAPRLPNEQLSRFCVATNGLRKMRSCLVSVCNVPFSFNTLQLPVKREHVLPRSVASGLVVDLDYGQILLK